VAILGAGVSGRAAAAAIAAFGGEAVVYDRAGAEGARTLFDACVARGHALAIASPGLEAAHPWLEAARAVGCEVWAELDLGAVAWPGKTIAVTGTNGKTTLTEFLAHALRSIGRDARAVGNNGRAFSAEALIDASSESIAVCEVSSFQAEQLRVLVPEVALWTNFAEDHLERHGTMESYFRAKHALLARAPAGMRFHGPEVARFATVHGIDLEGSSEVDFVSVSTSRPELAGTVFAGRPQLENFLLARACWHALGYEDAALWAAARSFVLGPHRLARVAEIDGVVYWNDSKATNFHATEAALAAFDAPVLLVAGGKAKGGDIDSFARRIAPRVRKAFLLGETSAVLARALQARGIDALVFATLRDAVQSARLAAVRGDHVLLSPGFASFDMFKGYDDRGRQFEAVVATLAGSTHSAETSVSQSIKHSNRPARPGLCLT
jgi:UDP-N-acetylmuramoylalanine--D-glutamate ligase